MMRLTRNAKVFALEIIIGNTRDQYTSVFKENNESQSVDDGTGEGDGGGRETTVCQDIGTSVGSEWLG